MLSKTEMEFLKNPEGFDAGYTRVMRHRIKTKAEEFRAQIALLQGCGALAGNGLGVTENCNGVTEYCNAKQSLKQTQINELGNFMAGPVGFEPTISGSEGRHLNPC